MENRKSSICPCCGQTVKVYKRSIRSNMVFMMRKLVVKFKNQPMRVNEIDERTRVSSDFTKLMYWGLITPYENETYFVNETGLSFLRGECKVVEYKYVFNKKVQVEPVGTKNRMISVDDIKWSKIDKQKILEESIEYAEHISKIKAGYLQQDLAGACGI